MVISLGIDKSTDGRWGFISPAEPTVNLGLAEISPAESRRCQWRQHGRRIVANYTDRPAFDLEAGRAVLDEDLPKALARFGCASIDELGWRRPTPHTLLIPMTGTAAGKSDDFLLKLHFRSGREWPPSAQFVNPETLDYTFPTDARHLPILEASHVYVHPNISALGRQLQLICCSATYEYYDILHSGEEQFLWQNNDTFLVTLDAIRRAMGSASYKGRNLSHES